jgi:hypothetical protein
VARRRLASRPQHTLTKRTGPLLSLVLVGIVASCKPATSESPTPSSLDALPAPANGAGKGASCIYDDDCATGLRCDVPKPAPNGCGTCTDVPPKTLAEGEACETGAGLPPEAEFGGVPCADGFVCKGKDVTATTGTCVRVVTAADGEPCNAVDRECGAGSECGPYGRCIPKPPPPPDDRPPRGAKAPCDGSSETCIPKDSDCAGDSSCAPGLYCITEVQWVHCSGNCPKPYTCQPQQAEGASCTPQFPQSTDCADGLACDPATSLCAHPRAVPLNAPCDELSGFTCPAGICAPLLDSPFTQSCLAKVALGAACVATAQCPTYAECNSGVCRREADVRCSH